MHVESFMNASQMITRQCLDLIIWKVKQFALSLMLAMAAVGRSVFWGPNTCELFCLERQHKHNPCCQALPHAHARCNSAQPSKVLRTPHSGYHFDGSPRRFFEGWYFKVSLPHEKQSFAWMYSAEDPAFGHPNTPLQQLVHGPRFPGIGAQVMGADDQYLFQFSTDTSSFWGRKHDLALGNVFLTKDRHSPPKSEISPQDFWSNVEEGFQVTPTLHQGFLRDNGRSPYVETVETVRWQYTTVPVYGWGDTMSKQKSTAGWLAAFAVFEPHWQICMAAGLSTGWIQWGDRKFEFVNAPSYSEKNWGGSFPEKWFWVQCNVFEGGTGEIALTAGGGRRYLPVVPGLYEDVAMVGIHYEGKLYEFVPWVGPVEWEISTWGLWRMHARNSLYEVEIEATANSPGTVLRAPTQDSGLAPLCKDTFSGCLKLQIWECASNGNRKKILDVSSDMAALEVGGGPWYETWKKTSETSGYLKPLLGAPLDVDNLTKFAPFLKPPGL